MRPLTSRGDRLSLYAGVPMPFFSLSLSLSPGFDQVLPYNGYYNDPCPTTSAPSGSAGIDGTLSACSDNFDYFDNSDKSHDFEDFDNP